MANTKMVPGVRLLKICRNSMSHHCILSVLDKVSDNSENTFLSLNTEIGNVIILTV